MVKSTKSTGDYYERIMGEGAFGKVKRVEKKKGKANYALKYIDKKKCISKHATINMFRERMVLERLHHPFIVNLRYAFQDDNNLFMVIDLAEGGDLRNHLDRMKGMKDDTLTIYAAEVGCALDYLHHNKIIHRDLKPENLLLDARGHILLTDFNVCVNLEEANPQSPSGTRPYMAPEMFINKPYGNAVDWWALGIILFECTYGKRPFKIERELGPDTFAPFTFPTHFNRHETVIIPENLDRNAFYLGLLNQDVKKRLGSSNNGFGYKDDIQTHPWLKHIDWSKVETKELDVPYKPNLKTLNVDTTLVIDEIIGGGDGLSYKARKDPNAGPSLGKRIGGAIKKMLGIKKKPIDPNAPKPVPTREELEMKEMDDYYTNYNWELPDQRPMVLPPRGKSVPVDQVEANFEDTSVKTDNGSKKSRETNNKGTLELILACDHEEMPKLNEVEGENEVVAKRVDRKNNSTGSGTPKSSAMVSPANEFNKGMQKEKSSTNLPKVTLPLATTGA